MGRYVRKMQLMLTSMANFSVRQTLLTWISLLLGEQFNPDRHCLLQRLDWNNLAQGFSLASAIGHSPKIVQDVREFAVQFVRDDFQKRILYDYPQ